MTTLHSAPVADTRPRIAWWRIFSWQMYDFADTIYSMNVYTYYFGLFIGFAYGRSAADLAWALALANLVVAVTSPLLGAMSDASQRRLPFLRFFAVGTFLFTLLIGWSPSFNWAVAFFVLSYLCYSSAGNFYQALLPGLVNEQNVSKISGIGVGLGYCGSIFGLLVARAFITGESQYALVFPLSAVLFLICAIPGLTLVPDFAPATRKVKLDIGAAYRRVATTVQNARQYPGLFRFLVADFVYENAVAAVIGSMVVYATRVVGFVNDDLTMFMIFSTIFAVIAGFLFGPVVDRIGPKISVLIMLTIWLLVLPAVALSVEPAHIRYLGPVVGVGLAATWISSRTYLIALAPVEKSGEFFGLYALSGKSAGLLGQGVWALTLTLMTDRVGEPMALRIAVWVMWTFIIAGGLLVLTLPNVRPSRANVLDRSAG